MAIDKSDVGKVAHLARIALSEQELSQYAKEFETIMAFIDQINATDTDCIEALASPCDTQLRLREDTVTESNDRKTHVAISPQSEAGLYLVPRVIE